MSLDPARFKYLIDVFGRDPDWWPWSLALMEEAKRRGPLRINEIVYAEASTRFITIGQFETTLDHTGITVTPIPRAALFLAGKVFLEYRQAGGSKANVLPDFFIGAHARSNSYRSLRATRAGIGVTSPRSI